MTILSAKDPAETITVAFDFAALTAAPLSPSVAIEVVQGTDPSASAMLSGGAAVSGSKVFQRITGGLVGCAYNLRCTASASDGSTYVVAAVLPVQYF